MAGQLCLGNGSFSIGKRNGLENRRGNTLGGSTPSASAILVLPISVTATPLTLTQLFLVRIQGGQLGVRLLIELATQLSAIR